MARSARIRAAIGDAGPVAVAITAAGTLAALLVLISEFATVASVDVASGSCEVINDAEPELADRCELSGFERHGGAYILLGLLGLVMAWGAGLGWSRPAAVALAVIGGLVLGIGLLSDLPEAGETGAIGRNFEGARASKEIGLWLELLGGALAVATGAYRLTRRDER